MRDLSRLLHPAMLDDLGLPAAIDWYLKGFGKRHGVRIELLQDRMDERLPPETEAGVYRIVQEALTNVAKHAQASTCRVFLQRLPHTAARHDRGRRHRVRSGREAESRAASRASAWSGFASGSSQLRGELRLESAPGQGTRLTVEVPRRASRRDGGARWLSCGSFSATITRSSGRGCARSSRSAATGRSWPKPATAASAVKKVLELEPDVAVLDIGMPLLNGIEATRQIVKRAPERARPDPEHALRRGVHHAGAAGGREGLSAEGFGRHRSDPRRRGRGRGKLVLQPAVAKVMLDDYVRHLADKGIVDRYDALSEREREVFQLIAEGHSNKEIADVLSISPATVETHRAHIFQKLDLHNTAEVVLYAVRRGVIS